MRKQKYLLAVLLAGASVNSYAQTVVPSSADPVKAAERFQADPFAKPKSDPLSIEENKSAKNPNEETFILGGVEIKGLTVYKQQDLAELYKDKIGKHVTVNDVQKIAGEISEKYRQAGYALTIAYVPTQNVNDNEKVIIQVEEGRIGEVTFSGDQPPKSVTNLLNKQVDKMRREFPVRTETLERSLLLINDLPGNTARAVMRPSAKKSGATDLIIYYVHKPFDVAASTDNRGSRYLGPWQHTISAASNSALGLDERISVRTITTSPTDELRYIDMQYEQPINASGTKIMAIASYAKTNPGESLKSLHVNGKTVDAQVKIVHPFLRSRLENLSARATIDVRNSVTDLASANYTDDRVRSIRVGGSYDIADENGATIIDAELSHGIDGLGATNDGTGRSSIYGKHDYTKVNLDISRNQPLYNDISMLLAASGQYSFDPLLSSEQYLLGGPVYGTAYDPGELSGDHGLAGKAELRYGHSLNEELVKSFQLYSYYDIGAIWRKKHPANEDGRDGLSSYGIGVRAQHGKYVTSNLELSIPLTHDLIADRDNGGRIYGGLSFRY